jgi:hypothetical protein
MAIEALEGVTDQELFDEANADEAPNDELSAEAVQDGKLVDIEQQEQPTEQTQARDEQGRFAAETPAVEAPQVQGEQPRGERIPLAEYLSEREKRQTFENELKAERERIAQERQDFQRRIQALEKTATAPAPQAEEPDPLLDPKAYREFIREETRKEILNDRREASLANAHKTYNTEFEEAYAAAQKQVDPVLKMKMQNSRDPGETLIEWHREQKTRAEVGNDLNAFRQREQERLLSDPAFLAKAIEKARGVAQPSTQPGARPAPAISLPPSLTRATNASATTSADDDDVSDEGLWRSSNA